MNVEYEKKHFLNPIWMDKQNWLVYLPLKDGTYSKVCKIFGVTKSDQNSSKLDHLIKSPITFWTTACEKLDDNQQRTKLQPSRQKIS